jgi:hypothetical protein
MHQVAHLHGRYSDVQNLSENDFMLEVFVTNLCPDLATLESSLNFQLLPLSFECLLVKWGGRLLRLIAKNVPENEVDGGTSQPLEFSVIFLLTDSC